MRRDEMPRLHNLSEIRAAIAQTPNPLDFIADDHMREREICAKIDRIAACEHPDASARADVVAFLRLHLPYHLEDEETDLFPMMLERCQVEDEIERVIAKLQSDHRHALADSPAIITLLKSPDAITDNGAKQLTHFAAHARRHLILENAIILPIARARLTPKDLTKMKLHMQERRRDDPSERATTC